MAKKPLQIDCIAGSQLRDTQGEMLSVEGADISELQTGKGRWNDNHGKGFFNSIGRITEAKKILKAEDCENDRHRYYWDKVKVPFIYASGYLYDDEDHPNARAAAAILRNLHKNDVPLQLKASVEGGVVARGISDKSLLARTKIHSVALTFTPANNNTLVEPISLDKSDTNYEADLTLIKSVIHLAETNVPSFRHIVRDASASRVQDNINRINDIVEKLGLNANIAVPSKQHIIKKSIEQKIKDNIVKINEIVRHLNKNSDYSLNNDKLLHKGDLVELNPKINAKFKKETRAKLKSQSKDPLDNQQPDYKYFRDKDYPSIKEKKGWDVRDTGVSDIGANVRNYEPNDPVKFLEIDRAKSKHKDLLNRLKQAPKPNLTKAELEKARIDEGKTSKQKVFSRQKRNEEMWPAREKGVHRSSGAYSNLPKEQSIKSHKKVIHDLKQIPKPNLSNLDLEKGIRSNIASAAIGASMLMNPQHISETAPTTKQTTYEVQKPTHQEVYKQVAKENPLLGAVGYAESGGATNMDHKVIRDPASINYTHRAGGMFGMMPNTAAFAIKKDEALAEKYPDLADAAKDISKNHKVFTERFNSDPIAAADFAKSTFKRNSSKTMSPEQLIYSWNHGLKGSWNTLKNQGHDAIKNHEYVKKVMDFYNKNTSKPKQKELLKALMAGYGGAGSPISNVSGAVLQSESLDDGRVGFKHLTCNNCGKEQIHSKFQVKCRHCGHGLSFEKLYEVMRGNK